MSSSLLVKNLAKSHKGRQIVKDVSLEVHPGEVVGLLGPNGAGKTTSFYMILGLTNTDAGQIILNGHDITKQPIYKRARAGLGYLPQETSIFRRLTVRDNLLAILETRKELDKATRVALCDELLNEFHVGHLSNSLGQELSGGERRRVEIARALTTDPAFILLDEPFAGVDPISIGDIKAIIMHLRDRSIGVLITDHNVRETLDICERAYIMNEGHIIAAGSPDEVLKNPNVRTVYLGDDFRV